MDDIKRNAEGLRDKRKKQYVYGELQKCVICESIFVKRDRGAVQQCCSYACRGKLQTKSAKKECAVCGVEFLPKRPEYKTCGRKCGTSYRIARRTIDPMVEVRQKLASFCCGLIHRCFRAKTDTTSELLGYSVLELKAHLESHFLDGMHWGNYGNKAGQWSIDHTRPISKFSATATAKEINALSNLRPMWHSQNCAKKNKWEGQ